MKKKSLVSIFLGLLIVMAVSVCFAATVVGSGGQTRGYSGHNAELKGQAFNLPADGSIVDIAGEGTAGFWIETRNGDLVANFNSFAEAQGYQLSGGTYYVYPNLRDGSNSAWVKVTFNCP